MSQWSSHFFHGLFNNCCGYVIKTFAGTSFQVCCRMQYYVCFAGGKHKVDWMLESFHFPRGPSMYGINNQQSVYMLVVLICSRIG